jgi:hypothetical protein
MKRLCVVFVVFTFASIAWSSSTTQPDELKQAVLGQDAAAKSGDVEQDLSFYHADGEQQQKLARAMAQSDVALAKLEKAVKERFGADLASAVVEAAGSETVAKLESVSAKIDGDHATLELFDRATFVPMVRVDGKWKISLVAWIKDYKAGDVDHLIDAMSQFATELDHLTKLVTADKFRSGEGVRDRVAAVRQRLFFGAK